MSVSFLPHSPCLPPCPPPGSPELRPEKTQPQAVEGSWREGDEVTLTCLARGYPEPKLTWSQEGGTVSSVIPNPQLSPANTHMMGWPTPRTGQLERHPHPCLPPQPAEPTPGSQGWVSSTLKLKVTSALSQQGVSCVAANPHGSEQHTFHFGTGESSGILAGQDRRPSGARAR